MGVLHFDRHAEQVGESLVGQAILQRAGVDDGAGGGIAHRVDAVVGGVLGTILHIRVLRDRPAIHMKTPRYLRTRQPLPVESPDILHNGHRYRHVPFLPERRPAATGRIKTDWQLGNIQAAAPMPITSPGNDDDTGENHQPTLRKNTAEPVEQTLKQNSRRLFARLVDDKSASATARAEYEIFKDIPPAARVDRTWDNGTEASLHTLVDEALGMLTYFADPYSSWQRGSNENRNGRIRRYLPKGTSFEDLTQDELDAIVGEINDTPMKLLGYKTPNEVWDEEIAKLQSKAASPNTSVALTN